MHLFSNTNDSITHLANFALFVFIELHCLFVYLSITLFLYKPGLCNEAHEILSTNQERVKYYCLSICTIKNEKSKETYMHIYIISLNHKIRRCGIPLLLCMYMGQSLPYWKTRYITDTDMFSKYQSGNSHLKKSYFNLSLLMHTNIFVYLA